MKKVLFCFFIVFFLSCSKNEQKPDPATISWIEGYDYAESEIYSIQTTGQIPAPKILLTVETITRNCIIDLGTYNLILNERDYDLQQFEPFRLVNQQLSTREMMLEEGVLTAIQFLNREENDIFVYLMKKSIPPARFSGLLGWQFFKGQQVTFDLKNSLIGIKECNSLKQEGIDFFTGTNPSIKNSMLKFSGYFYHEPVTMSVSTSLRHTQISPEILSKLNITHNNKYAKVDSITIGNHVLNGVTCHINKTLVLLEPEIKEPIDIIIGLNELKKFLFTINFCEQIIYLEKI